MTDSGQPGPLTPTDVREKTMYQKVCAACMTVFDGGSVCPACGAALTNRNPDGALPEGLLLGENYRIGSFVALDSEGAIYDAIDVTGHRAYRIKEYMPVTLCSGRETDFSLQVRPGSEVPYKNNAADFTDLYARLRHFNNDICLLGVHEVFYANNTVYAVTEKADGVSLTQYLQQRGGRLGWDEALDLLDPLWVAVERLHRAGIVHRGICCDNITVTGPGMVRLGGYATAAMRRQGTELKAQLYAGYAAPEQYDTAAFDGAFTDIYALCAVLYRVLTGVSVPPARERMHDDSLQDPCRYANAPLPDGTVQKLPLYLADAILHGLQLEGGDRFVDMPAFRMALTGQKPRSADAPTPAHVQPRAKAVHTEPERKGLWARMNTDVKVALCTSVFLLLVFVVVLLVWSGGRETPPASDSTPVSNTVSVIGPSGDSGGSVSATDVSSESQQEDLAPALVGKMYKSVRLEYHGLRFRVEYGYSEKEPGTIIDQMPLEGQPMTDGTISIVVSQGSEPVPLPDLVGSTLTSVQSLLDGMGIDYEVVNYINDGSWAEGVIVESDPGEGGMVQPGIDKVILRVATAKPVVSESSSVQPSSSETAPPESVPDAPPAQSDADGDAEDDGE